MLKELRLNNFRLFDQLVVQDMSRVTLVAGRNNSGKTAMLEAAFLLTGRNNVDIVRRLMVFRGIEGLQSAEVLSVERLLWSYLFPRTMNEPVASLQGIFDDGPRQVTLEVEHRAEGKRPLTDASSEETYANLDRSLKMAYRSSNGHTYGASMWFEGGELRTDQRSLPHEPLMRAIYFSTRRTLFSNEDAERFSRLAIEKRGLANFLRALKLMEPHLVSVDLLHSGGKPMLWGDVGLGEMLPLAYMGDGIVRLAALLLAIEDANGGVVLVDEIDTGFHHSVLPEVWQVIDEASKSSGTQVIATTHSLECIKAANKWFSGRVVEDMGFRLVRVERTDAKVRAVTFKPAELEAALTNDLEVR